MRSDNDDEGRTNVIYGFFFSHWQKYSKVSYNRDKSFL